jgi:F-type H+-transporting ATPase subunit c
MVLDLQLWACRCGYGVGIVFGSLVFGLSRNPSEEARLFKYSMLGFALTEA